MPLIDLTTAPAEAGTHDRLGSYESLHLGEAGGLTQFGVVMENLAPGSWSSDRHWHEEEDEFLVMLDGEAVLIENAGETTLRRGDHVAWPKGVPNAHHLVNRSDTPARFLVAGWRAPRDVVHYPDRDIHAIEGEAGREEHPGHTPGGPDLPSGKLDLAAVPVKTGSIYPEPYASMMKGRSSLRLGQAGGLTQFGANLVTLEPGALASLRHWHAEEDEFLIVTEGTPHLVDDHGRHAMAPGDCAAFPAGEANGHHLVNDTDAPVRFLVFGTKAAREVATYSDHDFRIEIEGANATFTYRDGTPWEGVR